MEANALGAFVSYDVIQVKTDRFLLRICVGGHA